MQKSVSKDAKDWNELLPFMLFAYRGAKHATTGFSPYELVYGREMRDTVDVLAEHWEDGENPSDVVPQKGAGKVSANEGARKRK